MPDDHYDVIRHVLDEHGFEDGSFFYRFADEAPGAVAGGRPAGGASTATG